MKRSAFVAMFLLAVGLVMGRAVRPAPPPLVIQRVADPLTNRASTNGKAVPAESLSTEEDVYICGARTKKGTPCSRRVHGNVRCWQHKGMQPMLPPEKLVVKG